MQSISNYISEKIRNIAGNYINPATEEKQDAIVNAIEANAPIAGGATETTLELINQKKIGDSFWLKNVLSAITRLTVDASGQLRAVVSGTVNVGAISSVTTVTQSNGSIGDSGKTATIISQGNANFQGGGRRLIRKV